jgi:uncharacterized protein YndB with AHSA1/START domain
MTTAVNEPAVRPFIVSRLFDAPREMVWKAWTEGACLKQWFGPKGCTLPVVNIDFRPGGTCHFCFRTQDGHEMWGKSIYREIAAPAHLVYLQHFSDPTGGITRHPMSPGWPLQMLTNVIFAEQNRKTLLTVRWTPLEPTDEERQTFNSGNESMKQGWGGSFDQLADYLSTIRR